MDQDSPVEVVRRFCRAWSDLDVDALAAFFSDDAVYHNIPIDPVVGRAAIRDFVAGFTAGAEQVEFQVRHVAADGDVVLTERVDVFVMGGRRIELPVMGTFEVRDGRITAWRDYFDLQQFTSQMATEETAAGS
ncbi:MAG: SgcJ/EcaC family oxidoreductase [Acidimicrobiia bacterium]|nr:SgcJ/EcaC family oxidoreductase [Acidimicrobiia bacterium]